MASFTLNKYSPKVGDYVQAIANNRLVRGIVLADPKNLRRPYIRKMRSGAVLCAIDTAKGHKWVHSLMLIA